MSFRGHSWLVKHGAEAGLRGNLLLVAILLSEFANTEGVCWPGIRLLADRTGIDRKTVKAKLEELVNGGFVSISEQGGGRTKRTVYRLQFGASDESSEQPKNGGVTPPFSGTGNGGATPPFNTTKKGGTTPPFNPTGKGGATPPFNAEKRGESCTKRGSKFPKKGGILHNTPYEPLTEPLTEPATLRAPKWHELAKEILGNERLFGKLLREHKEPAMKAATWATIEKQPASPREFFIAAVQTRSGDQRNGRGKRFESAVDKVRRATGVNGKGVTIDG